MNIRIEREMPPTTPIRKATVACAVEPDLDYLVITHNAYRGMLQIQPHSNGDPRNSVFVKVDDIEPLISVLREFKEKISS